MRKYLFLTISIALLAILGLSSTALAENLDDYIEVVGSYSDYGNTRTSGFLYSDSLLLRGSSRMSGDLCKISSILSGAAYNSSYASSMMEKMGYSPKPYDYSSRTLEDNDRVAYTIGKKESNGYVFYCVAIRGTTGGEWFSNFNIGTEAYNGNHAGFHLAAAKVFNNLNSIMDADGHSSDKRILWFTGHSRGAAVANILAASYTKSQSYAIADHIFGYTFACPAVSKNAEAYSNIFNFNNTGDVVISVPLKDWGYNRYGKDFNNAFTGDIEFEMKYYSEVGHEYGSTYDTLAYEEIIKTIIPSEDKLHDPIGKLGVMLLAYGLGGNNDVKLNEVLEKYGEAVITDKNLWEKALGISTLRSLYNLLDTDICDVLDSISDMKAFLKNAIDTIQTEEDFYIWLMDDKNEAMFKKITEHTGMVIDSFDDLSPVYGTVLKLTPSAWNLGKILGCVLDIIENGGGDIMESVTDGHSIGGYIMNMNDLYFGYCGHEGTTKTSYTIPDNIVTIGQMCFANSSITSIEGLDHIEAVGSNAFYDCTDLTSVQLETEFCYAGDSAFYNCAKAVMNIPGALQYVGSNTFYNCQGLSGAVQIKEGLKSIGQSAFSGCSGLEEIIIPDSVKSIGQSAFSGCSGLEEITIPDSVESIAENGFGECSGLKKIRLPISTNYVVHSYSTFGGCRNVEEIVYTPGNGSVFEYEYRYEYYGLPQNASESLKVVTYEEGITTLPKYALNNCRQVVMVNLPSSLTSVSDRAFYECSSLVNMAIPESVTAIGDFAFCHCSAWSGNFPTLESTESIGSYAFSYCQSLTGCLKIPEGMTKINSGTFAKCTGIDELIISDTVEQIGAGAFENCTGLTKVTIPISCNYISNYVPYVFSGCGNVEEIVFTVGSGNVFEAGSRYSLPQFAKDSLKKVSFTEGITSLPAYVLRTCRYVTEVNLPSTLLTISEGAFQACNSLTSMEIKSNITEVGSYAFSECFALTDLELPESLISIGDYAFYRCKSWCGDFPIWETTQHIGNRAFAECESLKGMVKIPDGIKSIEYGTFDHCIGLTEVIIPDGVESIGGYAFRKCTGLKKVTLPISCRYDLNDPSFPYYLENCLEEIVYTVGDGSVFESESNDVYKIAYCNYSLKMITYSEGITKLPTYALYQCENLTTVNLPTTLEAVSDYAFGDCSSLKELKLPKNITSISNNAFCNKLNEMSDITLLVYASSYGHSWCLENNMAFTLIDVSIIPSESAWALPASLQMIDEESFCGLEMAEVIIPDGTLSIAKRAFADCHNLTYVFVPDSVTEIASDAFENCDAVIIICSPNSYAAYFAESADIEWAVN